MDHGVAPPTSMYSMKRISASAPRAYSMRVAISSSLTPRITTVSSLSPRKPARAPRARPRGAPLQHLGRGIPARERAEAVRPQRVKAHRDAVEAGFAERGGPLGEEEARGGPRAGAAARGGLDD